MTEPLDDEAIFHGALNQATAEERSAYLTRACGDDHGLHRRIERLLAAHLRAGSFLERPVNTAVGMAAVDPSGQDPASEPSGEELALGFLAPSSRPDSLGRIGHHEVLEVLGDGGMGIVLRAFDEKLHRIVALKALAPELAVIGAARNRFVREARASASVIHDNIVAIHAVEDSGPVPYLVLQFIDGPTLQEKLDRHGAQPLPEILRIGIQAAAGLGAAHAQGLVHRDIKPANMLLENGIERVKITDFGLARAADEPGIPQPGLIAGTPAYMSPEQANGGPLDHRSDLFSLGSVLYALCTGHAPFRAPTMIAVLKQVCEGNPPPIRELNPSIPGWLDDLIARLHAKDRDDRPQTAAEVTEVLVRHLAVPQKPDQGLVSDDTSPERHPSPGPERPRGTRTLWLGAVAAILVLGAGLGASEATGVTNVRGTVIRLLSPEGTLVVEVDDPDVSVNIDGSDLVITGAGAREIRVKAGSHTIEARKDGKVVRQELVNVARNGRQVVRVSQEPPEAEKAAGATVGLTPWERSVAAMPANEQTKAVVARMREINPGLTDILYDDYLDMVIISTALKDISPLRAIPALRSIHLNAPNLTDISPLRGMALTRIDLFHTGVSDLSPLEGLPLRVLDLSGSRMVQDLSPLRGLPALQALSIAYTGVRELAPIKDMKLECLNCDSNQVVDLSALKGTSLRSLEIQNTQVSDLSPLLGMPLTQIGIDGSAVTDLSPLQNLPLTSIRCDFVAARDAKILRAIPTLETINGLPAAAFWKSVTAE